MTDWHMPRGVTRTPLPPEVVLLIPKKSAGSRKKAEKAKTANQLKWAAQKAKSDAAAATFKAMCKAAGLPLPVREYRFAQEAMGREWEADFCWPEEKLCLEVEGGSWSGGRHTRGSGYLGDMAKYNAMTLLGYGLLRVVPKDLPTPKTVALVSEWFARLRSSGPRP